ncbi:MAG: formyltransferase family protein [Nanoarchaeota archaeon]
MEDNAVIPLHDARTGVMRTVAFMSGKGSNIVKLLDVQKAMNASGGCPYEIVGLFSDTEQSNARIIAGEFDLPVFVNDLEAFCAKYERPVKDMETRALYDSITRRTLHHLDAHAIVLGGYMRKITQPLLSNYICVNVHPADLSKVNADGKRIYTGDKAVAKALFAGERELRSTVHLVNKDVDQGPILMISDAVQVNESVSALSDEGFLAERAKHYQDLLKERGDLVIFPKTLVNIARGRYGLDMEGRLYFLGNLAPKGINPRLEVIP